MEKSVAVIWQVRAQAGESGERGLRQAKERKEHCGAITTVMATPLTQLL